MSKAKASDGMPPQKKKLSAQDIVRRGKKCYDELGQRRSEMAQYLTAYYGSDSFVPVNAKASDRLAAMVTMSDQNLLKAVCDSGLAQVLASPEVRVITSGSSWRKQIAARKVTRIISGVFYSIGLRSIAREVARDSMHTPVGAVRFWMEDDKKLRGERVPPHYIVYSMSAGRNPRQLWLRYPAPREELEQRFGKKLPDTAPKYTPDTLIPSYVGTESTTDRVEVWEYWERARGDTKGRHVMLVGDDALIDEEYDWEFFPVVPLKWGDSFDDFGGRPLAADVYAYHRALQRWNKAIDKGVTLACVPRLLKVKGSGVKQLTNQPMDEVEYPAGMEPKIVPGQAFGKEVYELRAQIKAEAFEFLGISLAFASAKKEGSLTSGRAIRENADQLSQRLSEQFQRIEEWHENCAKVALAFLDKAFDGDKKAMIMAPGTKVLEKVDWAAIDVIEDEYEIKCSAVAALTRTPSAKYEQATDLKALLGDKMTPEWMLRILNLPDVEKWEDTFAAAVDLALYQIERALEDNKPTAVETGPIEYLETLSRLGTQSLLEARMCDDAPPENLDTLRKLIATADHYLQQAQPPTPPVTPPIALAPAA